MNELRWLMFGYQWTGCWGEGCLVHRVCLIKSTSSQARKWDRLANGASVCHTLPVFRYTGMVARPEKQDALELSAAFSPAMPGEPGKEDRCGQHCCSTLHTKLHLQLNTSPQGSLENSAEKAQWLLSPVRILWVTTTCILGSTKWVCSTWMWGKHLENSAQ